MSDIICPEGWVDDQEEVEKILAELDQPFLSGAAPTIKGSGDKCTNLLYRNFGKLGIKYKPAKQAIGDCVSFATAHCIDHLAVTEIVNGDREEFKYRQSTEYIYGISRVQIGGGRLRGDGSNGSWAAKGIQKYGTVGRTKLPYGVDLTKYSGNRARDWGRKGPPKTTLATGKEHIVTNYSLCQSVGDVCDALANDNPVNVCSSQGFSGKRNKYGICKPSGSWSHSMAIVAVDTKHKYPSVFILNSWGTGYISGPKRYEEDWNEGFWCELDVLERMVKRRDTFAYSGFNGYEKKREPINTGVAW